MSVQDALAAMTDPELRGMAEHIAAFVATADSNSARLVNQVKDALEAYSSARWAPTERIPHPAVELTPLPEDAAQASNDPF